MKKHIEKEHVVAFDTFEQLAGFVEGKPILNKFTCIVKMRADVSVKHRSIMDSKKSGVTAGSRRQYRATLPRQTDIMADVLSLLADIKPAECIKFHVLDATDAYWHIPLPPTGAAILLCQNHPRWQAEVPHVLPHGTGL